MEDILDHVAGLINSKSKVSDKILCAYIIRLGSINSSLVGFTIYEIKDHDALVQLALEKVDQVLMRLVLLDEICSIVVGVECEV